ncbi:MAG TPA: hypothetical protein VM686_22725 [Polyangiaceae bacterium]|nr:hypothetical protein [Polyangiaceae bacterium]
MSAAVSFRKAAKALGMGDTYAAAKRLYRMVCAAERDTGAAIAVRADGARARIRVHDALRHIPELRAAQENKLRPDMAEASARFRQYLDEIDDRLRVLARGEAEAAIDETVRPQLDELRMQDHQTMQMLTDLAERVAIGLRPVQDK